MNITQEQNIRRTSARRTHHQQRGGAARHHRSGPFYIHHCGRSTSRRHAGGIYIFRCCQVRAAWCPAMPYARARAGGAAAQTAPGAAAGRSPRHFLRTGRSGASHTADRRIPAVLAIFLGTGRVTEADGSVLLEQAWLPGLLLPAAPGGHHNQAGSRPWKRATPGGRRWRLRVPPGSRR